MHTKKSYVAPVVRTSVKSSRKSKTVPDQALTMDQIMSKMLKGIPVEVNQRKGMYVDQTEHDLESLTRLPFDEKREFADEQRRKAQAIVEQSDADKRSRAEAKKQKQRDEAAAASRSGHSDNLDNTMPIDTNLKTK